jgi:hypothetical protein
MHKTSKSNKLYVAKIINTAQYSRDILTEQTPAEVDEQFRNSSCCSVNYMPTVFNRRATLAFSVDAALSRWLVRHFFGLHIYRSSIAHVCSLFRFSRLQAKVEIKTKEAKARAAMAGGKGKRKVRSSASALK